ncbi:cytochrome P450 736A117-like [Solanum stenotomum]|uniref:cytochrome P450 736A117-like n=1 Tax=Solanum stenotomum TaxID=172797 RepID=UPI0020D14AB3|nr:cytochrome P450 736A117-like [Solanum stenotomum]
MFTSLQWLENCTYLSYVLALSLLISFVVMSLLMTKSKSKKILPPSPLKLPLIGHMHKLGVYPHHSLHKLAQQYGPLMFLKLGSVSTLVVSSAEAASEIMKTHDLVFCDRPKSNVNKKLLYNFKDVSVAPYGEYWRQMRSICVLQLLSTKRVQGFRIVREEETALLVKKIKERSPEAVDLSEFFMTLTNDIVSRAAFGRKYSGGESGEKFRKLMKEFVGILGGFDFGTFLPSLAWIDRVSGLEAKVDRVAKEMDEFLEGVVEEHLDSHKRVKELFGDKVENENREDFVDVLLGIYKQNMVDGFSIDRDGIKALIVDIFAGGTDTTYTVLEWAMTELLRHPGAMNKLQNEAREITKAENETLSEDDLDKMHYLKAVIKETLRLHPPIPLLVPRQARQDVKVMGYDVAAGTMVITNGWAIGRDPEIWDDAEEFKPERFLNSSIDFKGHDFGLIPFGAGRRGCPGISFAMATNELVLANVVREFDWKLPNGAKGDDLDMTECTGLTIHRKVPLFAVATSNTS